MLAGGLVWDIGLKEVDDGVTRDLARGNPFHEAPWDEGAWIAFTRMAVHSRAGD